MSCEKMETRILGYADGSLKESERREVEKHLASCAPCSLRLKEFRAVSDLLRELPMIEPSDAFDTRVRALVAAEPVARQSWWAWLDFSPRIAVAASMLLIAALYLGISGTRPVANLPDPQTADAQMIQYLPVLEDHDVLQNFEPLKDLPAQPYEDDAAQ